MSAPFFRGRPWHFAHVFHMPTPMCDLRGGPSFFFRRKYMSYIRWPTFSGYSTPAKIRVYVYMKTTNTAWGVRKGTLKTCTKNHGLNWRSSVNIRRRINIGFFNLNPPAQCWIFGFAQLKTGHICSRRRWTTISRHFYQLWILREEKRWVLQSVLGRMLRWPNILCGSWLEEGSRLCVTHNLRLFSTLMTRLMV